MELGDIIVIGCKYESYGHLQLANKSFKVI